MNPTHVNVAELQARVDALEAENKRKEELISALRTQLSDEDKQAAEAEAALQEQIDDQHRAENERVLLSEAVEQIHEGVLIADTDGKILYLNQAFERHSGYDRKELVGKDISILRLRDEHSGFEAAMQRAFANGGVWQGRIRRGRRKDDLTMLEITVSPIKNADGEIVNYISVERDVSNELKLKQKLQQAQKMQALGTLAGGIAHDFNNVLMPIIINTELMLWDAEEDSQQQKYLEQCLDAAHRGKDLINQIVTFSRREAKKFEPVDIVPIVKEALKLLRASLPSTIFIHRDISPETGLVRSDPTQIHQILMNLCSNAADAMPPRGGELTVAVNPRQITEDDTTRYFDIAPGSYVELAVSDTGTGIEPEVLERIFEPFYTTKKPGEGTGMGLAVVDGIVKSHNGTIIVESKPEQGTTFRIYLPMLERDKSQKSKKRSPLPGGNERLLVVDDEKSVLTSLENILQRLDYTVVTTNNAQEALRLFRSDPDGFQAVLTDQTMPDLTGGELATALLAERPDLPIVLCTGYSNLIDAAGARKLGIRGFLEKPVSPTQLAETLRRVLDEDPKASDS